MSAPRQLHDLITRWHTGWAACRRLRRPTITPDAIRATLKLPGRHHELFALHADTDPAGLDRLAAATRDADKPTWLTVFTTHPDTVTAGLTGHGLTPLTDEPETFMTIDLRRHPIVEPAPPYLAGTDTEATPFQAVVTTADGTVAASGTLAVTGTDAVAHNIRTDPQHRRNRLASAVMTALVQRATDAGATTGLLVASPAGTALYSSLGWRTLAHVVTVTAARP